MRCLDSLLLLLTCLHADTYGYGVTPALGVMGGMLMLIGLYLMTFGFRIFRGTLGLVGFTVFGNYHHFQNIKSIINICQLT